MLECRGLSVSYGRHRALDDVALKVAPGEIVVILGANGAGKTTLLNAISGLVPSASGSRVTLDGRSLSGLPPHLIVESGVALVPEGRGLFGDLTVRENLLLGAYARRARATEREHLNKVLALFPKLAERSAQVARTMSGGEQQMVAIGKAMMSAPSILMLDEPSLGLSPLLCGELFKAFAEIRRTGVGILLVEQNARQGLAVADRGYILESGRIVGDGAAPDLARDPAVQKAYLGGAGGAPAAPSPLAARATVAVPAKAELRAVQGAAAALSTLRPAASADQLIEGSVTDLVRRAATIQSEYVRQRRALELDPAARGIANPAVRGVADLAARGSADASRSTALDATIAGIEAAAAAAIARRPAAASPPLVTRQDSEQDARGGLPAIEVYRRPRIEVYRRPASGGELELVERIDVAQDRGELPGREARPDPGIEVYRRSADGTKLVPMNGGSDGTHS